MCVRPPPVQFELARQGDKQKLEALEHSVKTLTEQNRQLLARLQDSRKKGRAYATLRPSQVSGLAKGPVRMDVVNAAIVRLNGTAAVPLQCLCVLALCGCR